MSKEDEGTYIQMPENFEFMYEHAIFRAQLEPGQILVAEFPFNGETTHMLVDNLADYALLMRTVSDRSQVKVKAVDGQVAPYLIPRTELEGGTTT